MVWRGEEGEGGGGSGADINVKNMRDIRFAIKEEISIMHTERCLSTLLSFASQFRIFQETECTSGRNSADHLEY